MNLASLHTFKGPFLPGNLMAMLALESGRSKSFFFPYFIANSLVASPALEQTTHRGLLSLSLHYLNIHRYSVFPPVCGPSQDLPSSSTSSFLYVSHYSLETHSAWDPHLHSSHTWQGLETMLYQTSLIHHTLQISRKGNRNQGTEHTPIISPYLWWDKWFHFSFKTTMEGQKRTDL